MTTDQVLAHIDSEAIARDTLAFVEVKSETCTEGPGSDFLAALLKREGFEVEMDPVEPGRPNVYTRIAGAGGGPTLAFNGHTDTIPIGISTPPGRDGDWIIGRGTEDMKGGLVAMVHAASALKKAGVKLAGDVWLTGVIGHEAPEGKKEGPKRLIEHLRSGKVPADAVIIVEGPCAVWAASLGSTIFNIEIKDDRGPIHTIKVPYETNPAHWVGELLVEFQEREEAFKKQPAHPLCGRQLYNVGIVQGGDYMNRLPAEFKISGTRRWTPGTTLSDIRAEFQEICDRYSRQSGMHWSYFLEGEREPFETPAEHGIVQALLGSGETVSGKRPEIIGMGLVGDANLYANDGGVKTVYYGPAHQTAHSDHERVSISQLTHCAKVYALAAMQYCGVAEQERFRLEACPQPETRPPGVTIPLTLRAPRRPRFFYEEPIMNGFRSSWDRRRFLLAAGLASTVGVLRPSNLYAAYLADRHGESYRALGVRPLINAGGTYTTLTGSVISPEVRDAMAEASRYFVPLIDLQLAVGERIAKIIGVEAAMVTCGATSSIALATAACVTQGDPEKIQRIPDTTGMKNEVIMVKSHRMGFDHAARSIGTKIIEVETPEELEKAINEKTAMLLFVHIFESRGKINRNHFIAAGKRHKIPVFNDAAAELPPATNLSAIVGEGFDLVGFSGGKGLRGPQASGILLGRKDLIDAAHKNNNPYSDTIGRAMKVGKEEIMGLLKAVEIYHQRDHDADQKQWRGFMERIGKMVSDVPSIQSEVYIPGPGGHPVPYLRVQWDQRKLGLTYSECSKALQDGEPRVDLNSGDNGLELASYNLFPGEERIVGMRLREVLLEAAKKA